MKGSTAITSSDIFEDQKVENQTTLGSKLKDMAYNFTVKAAEKAKDMKDKASYYINKIQKKSIQAIIKYSTNI